MKCTQVYVSVDYTEAPIIPVKLNLTSGKVKITSGKLTIK